MQIGDREEALLENRMRAGLHSTRDFALLQVPVR
jgi:hypothetical protein